MDTLLVQDIKKKLHSFKPLLNSNRRSIRYADEVTTPTGIVDTIRFEDAQFTYNTYPVCSFSKNERDILQKQGKLSCGEEISEETCEDCTYFSQETQLISQMVATCYEVKTSVNDFHNNNGHNFNGHFNYYVLTKDVYNRVHNEIPKHIGIIVYDESSKKLRLAKQSEYMFVPENIQCLLLYNALKKWVDKKQL